ncbi:hypothetical protein [Paracoccus benzoatiresistens]|uniref:Peptidase S9A N-terminal domain-containing protein n=1 Tax=Paracoccus benzoatiresistens TaxID=2997341 RepID=A0ABT4J7P4_9RHOB|nr:hypothetical protein [Paracoccus sp. EF6]MCZ0963145.1 hypothetical protein [Paracoccus sp. EF6]
MRPDEAWGRAGRTPWAGGTLSPFSPDRLARHLPLLRRATLVLLILTGAAHAAEELPMTYPETRKTDTVDTMSGVSVADPFRWLEADPRKDTELAD